MRTVILTLILCVSITPAIYADSKEGYVRKGNERYRKNDFKTSLKNYEDALKKDPESPEINFNLGTALYKNQEYGEAISHLQKGLLSDNPDLKKKASFNLGDALFKKGEELSDHNVDEAIADLEESLRQFTSVLNLDDKDKDAQYNHTVVQKELERLQRKKQEQKNRQDQSQDQKQDQKGEDQKPQEQKKDQSDKPAASSRSGKEDQKKDPSSSEGSSHEEKSDDKKPDQGFSQNQDARDKGPEDKQQGAPQLKPGEMSKEEAKALLKQYDQSDEATGLLNFNKDKAPETAVSKDW